MLAAVGVASCGGQHGPAVGCTEVYWFTGVSFPVARFTNSAVSIETCVDNHCSTAVSRPTGNPKVMPTGIVDPPHRVGWHTARMTVRAGREVIYRGRARIRVRRVHHGGGACPSRDVYVATLSIDGSGRLVQTA
ncbi:MAG: hypothetical protein ACJ73S_24550 [Mycobacteriales bacterium]